MAGEEIQSQHLAPDPTQYQMFFPRKSQAGSSYVEARRNRKGMEKMDLAVLAAPLMEKSAMRDCFDWLEEISQIVTRIKEWNEQTRFRDVWLIRQKTLFDNTSSLVNSVPGN